MYYLTAHRKVASNTLPVSSDRFPVQSLLAVDKEMRNIVVNRAKVRMSHEVVVVKIPALEKSTKQKRDAPGLVFHQFTVHFR
jgi:hypothetical protein